MTESIGSIALTDRSGDRSGSLAWGRRYLMVDPAHFRIDYAINPFMDTAVQPDPVRARQQWETLRATLERCGAEVEVLAGRADSPDMVYAMNLGLALVRAIVAAHGGQVTLSSIPGDTRITVRLPLTPQRSALIGS